MWSATYAWTACALTLLIVEGSLAGSFVAAFFGLGAGVAALSAASGLCPEVWQQSLTFAVTSSATLLAARKPLLAWARRKASSKPLDADLGATAIVSRAMAANAAGEVMLHGSPWSAKNVGHEPLARGASVVVVRLVGLCAEVVASGEQAV